LTSDPLTALTVPAFRRLSDYVGVWAVEPAAGSALLDLARRADLAAHVAAAAPPLLKAALEYTPVKANGQTVAVVTLTGTLMKSVGSMSGGTSTVAARRAVRQAANDPEVAAILLAIDSPGGSVAGTADLAADVKAAGKKKPVWAQIEDLGASAAYWVASQADKVFANTATALVGSIGTLAVVYDLSGAADQAGVKTLVFGTGPLKGAGAPGAPVTEDQQAYFRGLVDDAQRSFDAAVRSGRGLTDRQLEAVKTGGVFGAADALDRKLVDGVQSLDATLAQLAAEARRRARSQTSTRAARGPAPVRSAAMDETLTQAAADAVAAVPTAAEAVAGYRAAVAAEQARIAAVTAVFGGKHPALAAQAVADGWTVDRATAEFRGAELEALRASRQGPAIVDRSMDRDTTRQALEGAMILRAVGRLDHPAFNRPEAVGRAPAWLRADLNSGERNRLMEASHRLGDKSLLDVAALCLRMDGREVPDSRAELIQAAFSGSTLTNIFTTNVNTVVLASYAEFADTTAGWTTTTDVADFKTNERPRVEVGPGLERLPRGTEAAHANYDDTAESYKIARYAKQFVIDEQDMIDDRFGVFTDTPRRLSQAAARLRPDLVYSILLANPTLAQTTRALFNSTDGNLGTTSALAAATLKTAIAAMMVIRENSVNLNLMPTHLIVPPTLRWTAKELLNSTQIVLAGTAGSVAERGNANTLADENLTLVSDPRLENGVTDPVTATAYGGSTSTWYLASTMAHTIEVAYLRGTGRAPQVRSFALDKGQWGMGWDIKLDIGAKALDWKGLRKTTA